MTILQQLLEITADWRPVFPQACSHRRGVRPALGSLVCLGRKTISRIIWTNGGAQRSWSGEYFLHSRSEWESQQLFQPILKRGLAWCRGRLVGVVVDNPRLRKSGRCIQQAFYQRDPMSPPFHCNLMLGLRFLQASLLVPLPRKQAAGARALPVRFQQVSRVKKPGRKASSQEREQYRQLVKRHNLSQRFVQMLGELRQALDAAGAAKKTLVVAGLYWQGGARRTSVRLLVITPTPYRKRKSGRLYYRRAAYLLTTDPKNKARALLRKEMAENPHLVAPLGLNPGYQEFTAAAAAPF